MYVGMGTSCPSRLRAENACAGYPARVPSDLEQQSSELVVQAARLVRAVRRRVGQPAGIRILALLDEVGPLGVTAIAEADRSSQPTISGAVSQLVGLGWVAKSPDPDDARRSVVALTELGRRRLAEARRDNGAAVAERLARAGRTADDVAQAVTVLRDVMDEHL
jgi:DNA-binding MarR family transcriptional regulator